MSNIIDDRSLRTLSYALNGLSQRQQAIANNVANYNTPNYKAQNVSFESELQRQMSQNENRNDLTLTNQRHIDPDSAEVPAITVTEDQRSMRADGNNVDVDWEMARLAETVINYNTVSELVSMKLAILKNVISSR